MAEIEYTCGAHCCYDLKCDCGETTPLDEYDTIECRYCDNRYRRIERLILQRGSDES